MLQIDHRESHDVDIFIPDPQLLAFLDPEKQDFQFEIQLDGSLGMVPGLRPFGAAANIAIGSMIWL